MYIYDINICVSSFVYIKKYIPIYVLYFICKYIYLYVRMYIYTHTDLHPSEYFAIWANVNIFMSIRF